MRAYFNMRVIFTFLFALLSTAVALGQDSITNGGFEIWRGGFFSPHGEGCCGAALAKPWGWGIPEQLMAMPTNHFVFKEHDTLRIHSGYFSAKLLTDMTTMDSAGDVAGGTAVLVPGNVYCTGILGYGSLGIQGDLYQTIAVSNGAPFADTPRALNFYMMMDHAALDTAMYAYAFTRWDSASHKEDTLAYNKVDLSDDAINMRQWYLYSDTIHYLLPGLPDTLHLIFYGGRNGDSAKIGNMTWLDDVSFYYTGQGANAGIVHLSIDDAVSVYPNPASSMLYVKADQYMTGYTIEMYDVTGSKVMNGTLTGTLSSYSIASLPDGIYLYRLMDRSGNKVTSGKVTIDN
jgi:hypothetical protein